MPKNRCIVIFRIGQMGDTIVSLPAIKCIRRAYPSAKMVLITDKHPGSGYVSSWGILGETGFFDEVLFYEVKLPKVLNILRIIYKLRKIQPDEFFYLVPLPRTNFQVMRDKLFFKIICGIKTVHNLEIQDKPGFDNVPREVDRLLSIVAGAGVKVPSPEEVQFDIPISNHIRRKIDRLMQEKGLIDKGGMLVAICPGSKMQAQRWSEENYYNLGVQLLERFPELNLLVIGGAGDKELGARLCNRWGGRTHNLTGISVLESAEVLTRCSVYIGNDTGAMHLAAAVNTPCIAVFSARNVKNKWFPYGDNHTVLRKNVPCSPCFKTSCDDPVCLDKITVEEVLEAF